MLITVSRISPSVNARVSLFVPKAIVPQSIVLSDLFLHGSESPALCLKMSAGNLFYLVYQIA